ncbi:MAG TPA: glycosyltransferase family 4 protein, partial [Chthoniobacterales bacterium]
QESETLWPDQPKGRWFGRAFHRFIEWRSWRDSERSVRECDLLNLPNEDERREMERDLAITARAIVEPYGLNDDFREALAAGAAPAAQRLVRRKICFIGMWGPRKGARDWPKIIAAIRARHPDAEFLFLGTMFNEQVVHEELGLASEEGIACRSSFAGPELPGLLADCTMALFPSYIEGFGLAVLEQLAAGLPTIAYDVSGPRQILPANLLVPVGDTMQIAARAIEILDLNLAPYEELAAECREIAARYRWSQIARHTIEKYRQALQSLGTME